MMLSNNTTVLVSEKSINKGWRDYKSSAPLSVTKWTHRNEGNEFYF